MRISLIAALAKNDVIGQGNHLPWSLPEDLKRFKAITIGKPVIMGRKTFESIGRPLPKRFNIVVSRRSELVIPGTEVLPSLESALREAKAWCRSQPEPCEEIFVIGGATLYKEALPLIDRMYLTFIDLDFEGDAYFPNWDRSQFREMSRERHSGPVPHSYCVFERISR